MFVKALGGLGAAVVGGLYAFGAFDAYPRTVDGSPEAVMESLADLDIREMPGQPGSTADAAGGVKPRFVTNRGPNRIEWVVLSGAQVAIRMGAVFEGVDGGKRTKITPYAKRGDAPEELTSPAFRSEGITLGLFQGALDAEIAEMTAPGWGPHCDKLRDNLLGVGAGPVVTEADGFKAIAKLHNAQAELIAAGCNPDKAPGAGEGFRRVNARMESPPEAQPTDGGWSSGQPASAEGWGD